LARRHGRGRRTRPDHRGRWMKTTRAPRQTHSLAWRPSLVAQMPDGLLVAGSEDCEARIETKMSEREAVDHAVTTGRFHQSTKSWPAIASLSATRQAFVLWVVNIPDVHQPSTRLRQTFSLPARTCPRVPASGPASPTCPSLVMKGSPVRVRASALASLAKTNLLSGFRAGPSNRGRRGAWRARRAGSPGSAAPSAGLRG
jgi:hypothetical protein